MSRKKQPKNSFKNAVESTPLLKNAYESGLKALGTYSLPFADFLNANDIH